MSAIIARLAVDTAFLLLGYAAHHVVKDMSLERKRLHALAILDQAEEIRRDIQRQILANRRQQQELIAEISRLKAESFDEDPRTWSSSDDAFLAAWSKAEPKDGAR